MKIPKPCPLHEGSDIEVPFVLIGDEGFGGTHLDRQKRIFNYRLTRARRYVECTFGILANKRRIFHRPFDVLEDTAIRIIKACTVLHNFVREMV